MSDADLRHLERRALTGDLDAAFRYALFADRAGVLDEVPSSRKYPFRSETNPSFEDIRVSCREIHGHRKVELVVTRDLRGGNRHPGRSMFLLNEDGTLVLEWSDFGTTGQELVSQEITAWVAAHPAEILLAKKLYLQRVVIGNLQNYRKAQQEMDQREKWIGEAVIEWVRFNSSSLQNER